MRTIRALSFGCAALATLAFACHKPLTFEAIEKAPDAIIEQGPAGTATWVVKPDGAVSATLKTPDGQPQTQPVTGQLTFAGPDGTPTNVPVQFDQKTGVLTASGPKMASDITPMNYSLTVGGTPWNGTIDVPPGGTQDLVDTGKQQGSYSANTVGPNGGAVETVGPDNVEVVANKNTGEVRAYLTDADNKPVDPGDRKITVAVEGEQPEVIPLAPEPQGHFVVGHLRAHIDPAQLTVAVNAHGATHACLVGWAPGSVVVLGPQAPRVHLFVDTFPGAVVVHGPHVAVAAPGVAVAAPGVVVEGPRVAVEAPAVVVQTPGVVVGAPGVVVGAPGVVVGAPGVVVGGPRVFVPPPPGVVVGGPGVVVEGGWGHHHGHRHEEH
jgi:hypothetical protein